MFRKEPRPLNGSTIVVSGAASGIGRALATRFSSLGCPVAMVDVDVDGLAETESMMSGPVLARELDVRERLDWMAFAADTADWATAPIGAVFNNAGVALSASVASGAIEEHDRVKGINFDGMVNGVHAFLPLLLAQHSGAIVNFSSVFGLIGVKYQSAYCASKFAVRGYTESLRQELVGTGVMASTVHPGGIKTNIARNLRLIDDPLELGRTPDEVAREFETGVFTTPEQAAKTIQRGVETGKARILVGPDAYVIDAMSRVAPVRYTWALDRVNDLLRRRAIAEQKKTSVAPGMAK